MKNKGRDIKKQPFAWQEKHILRLIKKTFSGTELSRYLLLYNTLTWMHSDFNIKPVKYFTRTINSYSGLSMRFIPQGIKTFQEFGIVKISGLKEDHTFITKVLTFTPENIPIDLDHLVSTESNNCHKSTIAENDHLIEHSLRDISNDISSSSKKSEGKPNKKKSSRVRMDSAAEFLTGSSGDFRTFDKVTNLVTQLNKQCKVPAFSSPQSPKTKYLKTLELYIKEIQAGKFYEKQEWNSWYIANKDNFPGEDLEGAPDSDVWDMIEFAALKYIKAREGVGLYTFYGSRTDRITLADFMFWSSEIGGRPTGIPDGHSKFWQFMLPLKKSMGFPSEYEEKIKKLYGKTSSELGREIYNNYKTLEISEKLRFCKSIVAIANYYNKHQKNLLKNNSGAVLVIPNLKKLFKFYVKWVKRSGFEHVPGVFPGTSARWTDFANWMKQGYSVDLNKIHKPKKKKKAEIYVEPEMSEDEKYERSILGSLYDLLDPEERYHKIKLWIKAQKEERKKGRVLNEVS